MSTFVRLLVGWLFVVIVGIVTIAVVVALHMTNNMVHVSNSHLHHHGLAFSSSHSTSLIHTHMNDIEWFTATKICCLLLAMKKKEYPHNIHIYICERVALQRNVPVWIAIRRYQQTLCTHNMCANMLRRFVCIRVWCWWSSERAITQKLIYIYINLFFVACPPPQNTSRLLVAFGRRRHRIDEWALMHTCVLKRCT